MDPRLEAMAQVLVQYSIGCKPGYWVIIQTAPLGEPLAAACAGAVLRAGGYPSVLLGSEQTDEVVLREASEEQLSFIPPHLPILIEKPDASIAILAPSNTRARSSADPAKMAVQSRARSPLMETMMRRSAEGSYHWTVAAHPTQAAAQDAGMSLREYEDFVYGAGLLDEPDPVRAWEALGERQERLIDWLRNKESVHITGPGTDLHVSVAGRAWENDRGHFNFPGGEIFTGPVEDATTGHISFTFPAFYGGREVQGVRLEFRDGKVVDASARTDEAYLHQMLDLDDGAKRLGEFAIGTNQGIQRFSKNTLFDEKIGGTLHMALGRSYPETGGTNESALHWDMVFDLRQDAEVTVDGQLFSRNGEIRI